MLNSKKKKKKATKFYKLLGANICLTILLTMFSFFFSFFFVKQQLLLLQTVSINCIKILYCKILFSHQTYQAKYLNCYKFFQPKMRTVEKNKFLLWITMSTLDCFIDNQYVHIEANSKSWNTVLSVCNIIPNDLWLFFSSSLLNIFQSTQ